MRRCRYKSSGVARLKSSSHDKFRVAAAVNDTGCEILQPHFVQRLHGAVSHIGILQVVKAELASFAAGDAVLRAGPLTIHALPQRIPRLVALNTTNY